MLHMGLLSEEITVLAVQGTSGATAENLVSIAFREIHTIGVDIEYSAAFIEIQWKL